jgi:hypothetical protein
MEGARPFRNARWGVLAVALLVAGCTVSAPEPELPDVLLVVLDTVRADRLSTYGYERPTSIQLDALAQAGVVFEDVTAPASWTWPSHASLFTGTPPWVHGAHVVSPREPGKLRFAGYTVSPMRADLPTLAERFAAAGYRRVSLAVNDWLGPELGLTRGFERAEVLESDAALIRAATELIRSGDGRPLFLFLNFVSAHGPYQSGPGPWGVPDRGLLVPETAPEWVRPYLYGADGPSPGVYLSRWARPGEPNGVMRYATGDLAIPPEGLSLLSFLYDAGVRGADYGFGRILEAWIEAYPEGVVAVTSDHGEAFGEHGLLQHKASVYSEVVRVPLVIAAPGRLPAGARVQTPIQLQDLYPTLLELAGIDAPPGSLVGVVRGEPREGPIAAAVWPDSMWADLAGGRYAETWRLYRSGHWALVYSDQGAIELYDLASDPDMKRDLAEREEARAAALMDEARSWFDGQGSVALPALDIPEATLERLQQLGYVAELSSPGDRAR